MYQYYILTCRPILVPLILISKHMRSQKVPFVSIFKPVRSKQRYLYVQSTYICCLYCLNSIFILTLIQFVIFIHIYTIARPPALSQHTTVRQCKPRDVTLHLKAGSYPVISPENITFPKHFLHPNQR